MARGIGSGRRQRLLPLENAWVNKDAIAKSLAADLETRLGQLEEIGAMVAAAHLETAIEALCREFGIPREASDTD